MIRLEQVTKKYGDQVIIDKLTVTIKTGEFFVLVGPSGCGKTTTLKMLNRLIPLTEGTIYIQNQKISAYDVQELRWNMGYVLQQIALFPHLTIEENIALVPELKKWSKEKIRSRVEELMQLVGLSYEDYRQRYPSELSGGQQQRIGVVRALAADPAILLMDEPFSALDPISREKLQQELLQIQQTINKTIVFVTHDMEEALKLADRICLLRDGKIEQMGTPEELTRYPKSEFVEQFIPSKRLTLLDLVESIEKPRKAPQVASTISIEKLLHYLTIHEWVEVVAQNQIIGYISREQAYKMIDQYAQGEEAMK